ncbi:MAG: 1,4-alpha-glucan branching protein GlgB, partial [Candidatus Cellulosilyticum pullistercoris]|nr:1,4-alpha-glucan branching protein GlgB [Candidatus Cellulosilyticum pullistercoris]
IGGFNNWDGRRHSMRFIASHGVWELFIPGLQTGESYRYEIKTEEGKLLYKSDPYATYYEVRPNNASVIFDERQYKWQDSNWMKAREKKQLSRSPMSIYEVHIGSWRRHKDGTYYSYQEAATELAAYIKEMGYTYVELMGIMEHPYDGSWGYQVTGYFAPTSRYGNPDDFRKFVDVLHQNGIGVILDWVPAHFPKDAFALEKFDGYPLYEKSDEKEAHHPHWGTLIFDYERPQVALFLIASALSWLERYHIDGLRVDAVASMLYLDYGRDGDFVRNKFGGNENLEAIQFLKHLNEVAYLRVPGITMIAEESTAWPKVSHPVDEGGLGFGFKWNMGWMNDFLAFMSTPATYREREFGKITFSLMYAFSENFIQVLSHDEVVHEKQCMLYKMPGNMEEKYANLKVAYGYLFVHPGKKMLFMGNEFAVKKEWNEETELEWCLLEKPEHQGIREFVKALNHLYINEKALWEMNNGYKNFEWIDCSNARQKILSFVRKGTKCTEDLVVVINFSNIEWADYRIGVPYLGTYIEVLNSDNRLFGGMGRTNTEEIKTQIIPWHNRSQSMTINIAPFSICVFKVKKFLRQKS